MVHEGRFELTQGKDDAQLTTYTFNTHTAKHQFCSTCGVCCFYRPRSNPDGVAVTIYCLDPAGQPLIPAGGNQPEYSFEVREFDGQNWEANLHASGIAEMSKR